MSETTRTRARAEALAYLRKVEAETGNLSREAARPLPPYDGDELLGQQ